MSLDLTLLVFHDDARGDASLVLVETMLRVVPDQRISQTLFALEKGCGRPVHRRFMSYVSREGGDVHYGNTQSTPYGEALLQVTAKELSDAIAAIPADAIAVNRAAWHYLADLPPNYGVALYWH